MPRVRSIGVVLVVVVQLSAACGSDAATTSTTPSTTMPAIETAAAAAPTTTVPQTTTTLAQYYEVQPGDSLSVIAGKFDVRMEDLITLNGIKNPDHIQVGQKLEIPPPTILLNNVSTTASTP